MNTHANLDPAECRIRYNVRRMDCQIAALKGQQVLNAHLADTFQERIDKLQMERDAQFNRLRPCVCGLERRDHLPGGKCPFESSTFKERE